MPETEGREERVGRVGLAVLGRWRRDRANGYHSAKIDGRVCGWGNLCLGSSTNTGLCSTGQLR